MSVCLSNKAMMVATAITTTPILLTSSCVIGYILDTYYIDEAISSIRTSNKIKTIEVRQLV